MVPMILTLLFLSIAKIALNWVMLAQWVILQVCWTPHAKLGNIGRVITVELSAQWFASQALSTEKLFCSISGLVCSGQNLTQYSTVSLNSFYIPDYTPVGSISTIYEDDWTRTDRKQTDFEDLVHFDAQLQL
jgi:hypothetical protein